MAPTTSAHQATATGPSTAVLFVQGAGEGAHAIDARLAASLRAELGRGYQVRYPRLPAEDAPDDAVWSERLAVEVEGLGERGVAVAHSAGAAALIRVLAERHVGERLAGIFLVAAPYLGPGGWRLEGLDFPPDLGERLPPGVPVFLYHGEADDTVPVAHAALYAGAIPRATVRCLPSQGHQLGGDLSVVAADIRRLASQ